MARSSFIFQPERVCVSGLICRPDFMRRPCVLARGGVGEGPVEGDPLQLPRDLLVEGADPDVADALSIHTAKLKSITLLQNRQEMPIPALS